jgi:tetratricopeptide (TPR) repeat protein
MNAAILLVLLTVMPRVSVAQGIDAAIELYEHGKFHRAAEILSDLTRKDPRDANARCWLGKTYLKLNRLDDAVREMEKAVELDPKNGLNHLWLARAYGNKADRASGLSRVLLIGNLRVLSLAKKARKEFETAAQLYPDNLDIRFDLLEFYVQAPGIVGGGKDKAEAQAREIARLSPRHGYIARAKIYEHDKEWNRARNELVQATVKFPSDADGYVDLAEFLLERRDYEGTAASAQKALALGGSIRKAKLYLAAAQIGLHRNLPGALQALQELVAGPLTDHDPTFEEVYYWLGQAYLAGGQNAEARRAFETSLGFNPDYSMSKKALAQIKALP